MEFARRAAAPVDADDGYGLPHPSPRAQMMMDALRRELWKESIRQEVIAAEIAERRELEAKVRYDLGLLPGMPLRFSARIQPVVLPHGDTFPLPHGQAAQKGVIWSEEEKESRIFPDKQQKNMCAKGLCYPPGE
ncbi:hypothetical protein E2562_028700 [Oryza meyeriana var. granulata]|uniref:Uncharacterized protein n=1 Tax=Oryza meyeriana var. granulata TaxID=110450 RepID=A0A6G1CJ85_9ORYZ|nr:hypothetical protein E2562_028700 [Oryza meyeriana var. granulata]